MTGKKEILLKEYIVLQVDAIVQIDFKLTVWTMVCLEIMLGYGKGQSQKCNCPFFI